jgi:hypothetical protein
MTESPEALQFVVRLGRRPCMTGATCPDVFLLSDGSFAVIGRDMTAELAPRLPADAGVADDERIVVVPRRTLVAARADIPTI